MPDQTRQRFGNYRIVRLLGQGSFADVYLGSHLFLKTEVAVKVLNGRLEEEMMKKFLAEVSSLRDLDHAHIVQILDAGVEGDVPYVVMDLAPGGTLRARHGAGE